MNISFDVNLPPDVEERLRAEAPDLSAAGREAFAVDLLRRGILTHHGLGQTLGLDRFETDALLKRHRVTEQSLSQEDVDADVQSLNAFFGEAGWLGRAGGNDLCHRPVPQSQRHDRGCVMELKDEREVEVTREKLRSLETRYQAVSRDPGDDAHIQELTLRSLKRLINQMKEEIARFEARRSQHADRSPSTVTRS